MNSKLMTNGLPNNFSGESCEVINPASAQPFIRLNSTSAAELDQIIQQATQAFASWKMTNDEEIKTIFNRITDDIRANKNKIAQLITQEQGKPLFLTKIEVN